MILSKPVEKLMTKVLRDVIGAITDNCVKFVFPATQQKIDAKDLLNNEFANELVIANASGGKISVLVSPNSAWLWPDLRVRLAVLAISAGDTSVQAINSAQTAKQFYNASIQFKTIAKIGLSIWNVFKKYGSVIDSNQAVCVNKKSAVNPLNHLSPGEWAALSSAAKLSVIVTNENGEQAFFTSHREESWIILPEGCRRLSKGTAPLPKHGSRLYRWNET